MHTSVWTEPSRVSRFSFMGYNCFVFSILVAFLVSFRLLLPAIWEGQFHKGWLGIALVFAGLSLHNCFAEWGFHRYVLHMKIIIKRFSIQHGLHHDLTAIVRIDPEHTGGARPIVNYFPIMEGRQHEAAAFPVWSLPVFWLVFSLELIPLQLLLPSYPILLGGYLAVFVSYVGYEDWHAIEHFPLDWWKKHLSNPRFGKLWEWAYAFHQGHHANHKTNEAIFGWFLIPLADLVFRTYIRLQELPLNGRLATAQEFGAPKPRWPIPWLDRVAERLASPEVKIPRSKPTA